MMQRINATTNPRRDSLEVGTGDEQFGSNEKRKEYPFVRQRRKGTSPLLVSYGQNEITTKEEEGGEGGEEEKVPLFVVIGAGVAVFVILILFEQLLFAMSPLSERPQYTHTDFEIMAAAQLL